MIETNPYTRKKEPELNRQLIIDAATDIGAESDWSQVTFQAIANRTGLSKGGIIHHFKNKEELLDELLNESLSELTDWIIFHKEQNAEKEGALAFLEFVLDNNCKNEKYCKTMRIALQAIIISPKYREKWDQWYNENIKPVGAEISTRSLLLYHVAEGIWFSENIGGRGISDTDRERIRNYIKQL